MVKTIKSEMSKSADGHPQLEKLVLPSSATLLQVLETIDRGTFQIALSCDSEGKLVGLLTDGDVRRALIDGAKLMDPAEPFLRRDFMWVSPATERATVLDYMQARRIKQIPILDAERHLCGMHFLETLVRPLHLPNIAVILAGGKGTRLRPFTENIPKPMLKVAGRPILERLVLHLVGSGIDKIYLATNYLGHVIKEHFQDGSRFGCQISYLEETTPLGTAGPLSALEATSDEPILVMNGDLVVQFEPNQLLRHHRETNSRLTIGLKLYNHQVPFGCVQIADNRVTKLDEKPNVSMLINAGIYALDPELLQDIPKDTFFQMTDLINAQLEKNEPVGYLELTDEWVDIGQKENLAAAREGH